MELNYELIEQTYKECASGTAQPHYAVVGPQLARISDHRQARRLTRRGWFQSPVRCESRGKVLMVHPKIA